MRTFKDANGVEWTIKITLKTAQIYRERMKRVETLSGVDFMDVAGMILSTGDVFFAADLLYEICRDEAAARGIDAEAFGELMRGRTLFDAITELTAEYLDFFPDPTTVAKARALVDKRNAKIGSLFETILSAAATTLDVEAANAEKIIGAAFSNGSESSESPSKPSTTERSRNSTSRSKRVG